MALDLLKRRSRSEPQSSEDRIHFLTERDVLWFEKLHRHGPLPTDYLLAYNDHLNMAENRARDRLTKLFHERKTPHNGRYLERPWQQRATPIRNQGTVHDITDKAREALRDAGMYHQYAPAHATGMWWQHEVMLACVTASIELAVLKTNGEYEYIFHDEICEKLGGTLYFPVEYENRQNKSVKSVLKPDRAFGIRYPDKRVRLFLVEADRSNEPLETGSARKSLLDNDLQYRQFIMSGQYQEAMKTKSGLLVMTLMVSETRMANVMESVAPSNFTLFKAFPIFGREFRTPPVMADLFKAQWLRPGREPFVMNKM